MHNTVSQLHYVLEGRVYHFYCNHDSPLPHVKEVLFQFSKYIGQLEDAHKEQASKSECLQNGTEKEDKE